MSGQAVHQGAELQRAREARNWTQTQLAQELGVSQAYVSLLESGRRPVSDRIVSTLRNVLDLSPTFLTPTPVSLGADRLPEALAALGYEPFGYARGELLNPTAVLLSGLEQADLPSRVVEGLPWLALRFPHGAWLVQQAKLRNLQNRLGFVVTLASELAVGAAAESLRQLVQVLEPARLVREDTLCHDSMGETERRWLRAHRSEQAEHWNLLTDLKPAHLPYAA